MTDQYADAKAGTLNQGGLGASSATDGPMYDAKSQNIIPTVDDAGEAGKGAEGADKSPDQGKESSDADRFDKHPRFQELNDRMKAAEEKAARAEAIVAELQARAGGKGGEGAAEAGDDHKPIFTYEDITQFDDDQLREKMEDKPKDFFVNLFSQMVDETVKVVEARNAQRTQQRTVKSTIDKFADAYKGDQAAGIPGYEDLLNNGEIKKFMGANPGHNTMSAYMMMTADAREKAAAGRAAREAAEATAKNKQAKDGARVLGAGPAGATTTDRNAELKDTKSRGGTIATIAQRLAAQRSQKS